MNARARASILVALLACSGVTGAATSGDGLSYTYAELSTSEVDIDGVSEDADDYGLRLSLDLPFNFNLLGSYNATELSLPGQDTETDVVGLGGGFHFGLTSRLDLLAEIQWLLNNADSAAGDEEETGYTVFGGARWLPLDFGVFALELHGGLRGTELERLVTADDSQAAVELGARAHVLFASLGVSYAFLEDDQALTLGLRASL